MKYSVEFLDYWHLSSGVSAGPSLDSMVVKDTFGIPYVPGKTIKGLVREMMEIIDANNVKRIFGDKGTQIAESYFGNATLDEATIAHLIANESLKKHLFSKITSTKIDANGLADDKTMREIEVVVPLKLIGEITCDNQADEAIINKALQMIKQIGLNRHRGLGRCTIIGELS